MKRKAKYKQKYYRKLPIKVKVKNQTALILQHHTLSGKV